MDFNRTKRIITLGTWDFNVIDIEDMDLYTKYIKRTEYPANLWTSNFAFLWSVSQSRFRKILWKIVDDMLVTFVYLRTGELYLTCLPFGYGDADKVVAVLKKSLSFCNEWNNYDPSSSVVKVLDELQLHFLEQSNDFRKYFNVVGLVGKEKYFSIPKLVSLKGKEFDTIRRKINKFHRLYPGTIIREYTSKDFEEVMVLGDYWSNTSGEKYSYIFDSIYFPQLVEHYIELDHLILLAEYKDKIIGLVSGGTLPTGESWWCLSKFMNDYEGLSELLIVELAKKIHKINPNIQIMNAANDLGPGGLRFFKERFRPVLDLRRFLLKLKINN